MYRLLLCWRYLLTRYLALACIVSVLLGVATLIVVDSVMSGFSTKLRDRLHGLLSDVLVEATSLDGFANPAEKMARIRKDPFLKDRIEVMSPTLEAPAMMQFRMPNGELLTRPIRLIGVDVESRAQLGGFKEHLINHTKERRKPSFEVPPEAQRRYEFRNRQFMAQQPLPAPRQPGEPPPPTPVPSRIKMPRGAVVGNLIASFRYKDPEDKKTYEKYLLSPGDQVIITTVSGARLAPVYDSFLVVDYFKSDMSEYDSNYVFVPLDYLQHLRTMDDRVTSILIKLKNPSESKQVVAALQAMFSDEVQSHRCQIETWETKQSPLLQAIAIEKGILNVLLFLIIAVAGFGILAIFSMIVAEKTRDIGILKALGASNVGVMKIFLSYGLLLGLVGTGLGSLLGLTITTNINAVEQFLSKLTGADIFPRDVYYFNEIPTDIQLISVLLVNAGAVAIAVFAAVLPALRAALLHPVRALRYE